MNDQPNTLGSGTQIIPPFKDPQSVLISSDSSRLVELRLSTPSEEEIITTISLYSPELQKLDPLEFVDGPILRISIWTREQGNPSEEDHEKNLMIGGMCVYGFNHGPMIDSATEVEIGITIWDRDYWSKGYGTDAVMQLCDHLFKKYQIQQVKLQTLVSNIRAQICYIKCGFLNVGSRLHENGSVYYHMVKHRPLSLK